VCVQSGYKTITAVQLCNAIWALDAKRITFSAFRAYVACFALLAAREAAARSRRKRGGRGDLYACYRLDELRRLLGDRSDRHIRRDLRHLHRAGLLTFEERTITVTKEPLPGSDEFIAAVSGSRAPSRPIPVPRPVIAFLARSKKPALARTVIAYLLRGLSFDRRTGDVKARGTVKLSWIVNGFGLSERAARYARGELVRLGWITRDQSSFQRKLNRDGAYFEVNLAWKCPGRGSARAFSHQTCGAEEGSQASAAPQLTIAPRTHQNGAQFAPPIERPKTPYGSKDQKTRSAEPAGVSLKQAGRPSIRDIRLQDLRSCSRMEELYWQAVGKGMLRHSEANALNWLAASVRAQRVRNADPVCVFVGIVRRGLWAHVTQEQEDRARQALARYRELDPAHFRERVAA
jgi:hypothetical protein